MQNTAIDSKQQAVEVIKGVRERFDIALTTAKNVEIHISQLEIYKGNDVEIKSAITDLSQKLYEQLSILQDRVDGFAKLGGE